MRIVFALLLMTLVTRPAAASCTCGPGGDVCNSHSAYDAGTGADSRCCKLCHIPTRDPRIPTCDECAGASPSPTPMPKIEDDGCSMSGAEGASAGAVVLMMAMLWLGTRRRERRR